MPPSPEDGEKVWDYRAEMPEVGLSLDGCARLRKAASAESWLE